MSFTVSVGFDDVERRYYVISSDVPGLWVETDTFEEFVEVSMDLVPDLLGERSKGAKVEFRREVALV